MSTKQGFNIQSKFDATDVAVPDHHDVVLVAKMKSHLCNLPTSNNATHTFVHNGFD